MDSFVYLIFKDGQEDPLYICSSEDLAKRAIKQVEVVGMLELGRIKNTWYETFKVITDVSQLRKEFYSAS